MKTYATRFQALFRLPDYRWLWFTSMATGLGSWIFTFVSTWQMYAFTHATSWGGIMVLATTMPGILVNLMFAGVVERANKKWLLTIPSAGIVLLAILPLRINVFFYLLSHSYDYAP